MRNLKKIISAALIITMLMSSVLVAFPAFALEKAPNDGIEMRSGFDRLFAITKKITTLPATYEATITSNTNFTYTEPTPDGPTYPYTETNYSGDIFASYATEEGTESSLKNSYFVIDTRSSVKSVRIMFERKNYSEYNFKREVQFDNVLTTGSTHHIAVTFDSANGLFSLYVDGVKKANPAAIDTAEEQKAFVEDYYKLVPEDMATWTVGGDLRKRMPQGDKVLNKDWWRVWDYNNYRFLRGKIHTAGVFTDVRSEAEIKSDMSAMPQGDTNLMAWYDASKYDSTNGILTDLSGNGYTVKKDITSDYTVTEPNAGLTFKNGFGNVYTANSKLTSIPQTFEVTMTPKGGAGYQEVITFSGSRLTAKGTSGNRYDMNVPLSILTIDQVHAGTNSGYGPSLRLYMLWAQDGAYKEGSVIFLGALEGNDSTTHDDYSQEVLHLAITIDSENDKVTLYRNGFEWNGPRKYEYLSDTGLSANDAGLVDLYNMLTVDSMPCHSIGGDFRMTGTTENDRYFRGTIYNAAMYSDVRIPNDTYVLNTDGSFSSTVDKTGIFSHIVNGMPYNDSSLIAWYNASDITEYGFIPDASGNGYTLMKGFGVAAVSDRHVPADFDGDGYTDEGAVAIGSLEELLAIEKFENEGTSSHVGKGGKYYLTANIKVPTTTRTGRALLYHGDTTRFTESIYLDGCGYTIEFDATNKVNGDSPKLTSLGLFGHGTYEHGDGNKEADLYIWNLNITGEIYAGSYSGNVAAVFRTGTSGYTEFKNLVVSTNVRVDLCKTSEDYYDKNGNPLEVEGAQRSVAGIIAKTVGQSGADVLLEDVTFAGSVTSYDNMHDDGGKNLGDDQYTIYSSSAATNAKSFYQTGLAAFVGTFESTYSTLTFKNCINMGSVRAFGIIGDDKGFSNRYYGAPIGGFLGRAHEDGNKVIFEGCVNRGDIYAYNENNMNLSVGGFLGSSRGSTITVTDSKNLGVIYGATSKNGDGNASGFLGRVIGSIVTVTNSTNEGAVRAKGRLMTAGILGIANWQDVTFDRCFNKASVSVLSDRNTNEDWGNYAIGGIMAYINQDNWELHDFEMTNSGNSGDIRFELPSGTANTPNAYIGGLIGTLTSTPDTLIENCTNSGNVTYEGNYSGWGSSGGILGAAKSNRMGYAVVNGGVKQQRHLLTLRNCMNSGTIIGCDHAGGIIDGVKDFNTYTGATAGEFHLLIEGCKNFGAVRSESGGDLPSYGTGGIVGDLNDAHAKDLVVNRYKFSFDILDCFNLGDVTGDSRHVGGILGSHTYSGGHIPADVVTVNIKNCVNAGTVTKTPRSDENGAYLHLPERCGDSWVVAAGIVAMIEPVVYEGKDYVKANIQDCINIGSIKTSSSNGFNASTFPITNCVENVGTFFNTAYSTAYPNHKDNEGHSTLNDYSIYKGHINDNKIGTADAANGNIFLGNDAGTSGSIIRTGSAAALATGHTQRACANSDADCWHEFSKAATSTVVSAKIDSYTSEYYTAVDKALLKRYATSSANTEIAELAHLLAECYTYNEFDYTTETWAPFFRARAEAEREEVFTNSSWYTPTRIRAIINKLEAARDNLAAPDYTILISAMSNTNIPEERMHNFELFSKMTYEDARAKANAALTSRSQVAINLAAEVLRAAYRNLLPTTPAYIIVIPPEIPTETQQIVSVMTSEFHDGCSLDVTVSYGGVMYDGVEDTIEYKLKKEGGTDIVSGETPILQFGKAESTTKSTTISVGDLSFSNPNVAGTYTDKATFNVSLEILDIDY